MAEATAGDGTRGAFRRPMMACWAACMWAGIALGADPVPATLAPNPPALPSLLERGLDFERSRQWQQAADVYDRALRLHGDKPGLRDRWRAAERRYSLARRYRDPSFRLEMLPMAEEKAIGVVQEVLRKVQTYFVEDRDLADLLRAGYLNVELALNDEGFDSNHAQRPDSPAVAKLRLSFAERRRTMGNFETLADALGEVRAGAELWRATLGSVVPFYMEFAAGACETLDQYTAHLTPNRLRDLYAMIDGNFVGLGVEVRGESGGLRIGHVLEGSPADLGGIRDGELIVAIDAKPLDAIPAEESANLLQGKSGSRVSLMVRSGDQIRQVQLVRREVVVRSVCQRMMVDREHRVGYLRLTCFQKSSGAELESAVRALLQEGATSLVLDLRGNPGGLLDVSVQVANQFIAKGTLVATQGRAWGQSWSHEAREREVFDLPLAVLVDGESASAAEILAGAIQDHGRGVVVGTRTYGKGSVQSIFPMQSASTGLRLTTARFFSPKGRAYEKQGVTPEVLVTRPTVGLLGEEGPVPRRPSLENDVQLRVAVRQLTDRPVTAVQAR